MKLFGGKLSVITTNEFRELCSHSYGRIKVEICKCKELDKLVVRVVESTRDGSDTLLGILVDDGSQDYFVAARSISGLHSKLKRLLSPTLLDLEIILVENRTLLIFQGGALMDSAAA